MDLQALHSQALRGDLDPLLRACEPLITRVLLRHKDEIAKVAAAEDDFRQAARLGVVRAVESFDANRGEFEPYAEKGISLAVRSMLRDERRKNRLPEGSNRRVSLDATVGEEGAVNADLIGEDLTPDGDTLDLRAALATLPRGQRQAVILKVGHGLRDTEVPRLLRQSAPRGLDTLSKGLYSFEQLKDRLQLAENIGQIRKKKLSELRVRVNRDEEAVAHALAEKEGMGVSEYVRSLLHKEAKKQLGRQVPKTPKPGRQRAGRAISPAEQARLVEKIRGDRRKAEIARYASPPPQP